MRAELDALLREQPPLLTVEATAELLSVSRMTVHRLLRRRELAGLRVGRSQRVLTAGLREYLERGITDTNAVQSPGVDEEAATDDH